MADKSNEILAKTTIEFNADQVKEIIANYVRENFPHCRDSVDKNTVKFTIGQCGGDERYGGTGTYMLSSAKVEMVITAVPAHSQFTR